MEAPEDKLTLLPDDILVDILSRMAINYAVSTSVLSRRWQFLWTRIDTIYLYKWCFPGPDVMYKTFVHIFQQLTCSKFHTFYLDVPYPTLSDGVAECFSAINSSIHQVCQQQVKNVVVALDLSCLDHNYERTYQLFRVPVCVLNNCHLIVLKLQGMLQLEKFVNLPNLEELYLSVDSLRCEVLHNLLKSTPKLKRLSVFRRITNNSTSSFCLSSQRLEYLTVAARVDKGEFAIDTPNLKRLVLSTRYQKMYRFVSKPSKLVWVHLTGEFYLDRVDVNTRAIELFRVIYNVNRLWIDDGVVKVLKLLYKDDGFPSFKSIKTLGIRFIEGEGNWNDVLFSVQCFPSVEYLKLSHFGWADFKWRIETHSDVVYEPLTRIKRIKLYLFRWTSEDIELINYILNNVETLELLILDCSYYFRDEISEARLQKFHKFRHQVLLLPNRSPNCEIRFHGVFLASSSNDLEKGSLDCQIRDSEPYVDSQGHEE